MITVEFVGVEPVRESQGAVAFDLRSREEVVIPPGEIRKVFTETAIKLPSGSEGLLNVRSSVGDRGLLLSNGTGVIDDDYTGPLIFSLFNANLDFLSLKRFYRWEWLRRIFKTERVVPGTIVIKKGERIGQLRVRLVPSVELVRVERLAETERGSGGFGSTGRG